MASAIFSVFRYGTRLWLQSGGSLVVRSCTTIADHEVVSTSMRHPSVFPSLVSQDEVDTVESLLKSVSVKTISAKDGANLVCMLGKLVALNKSSADDVLNDTQFHDVCAAIDKNITSLSNSALVATLKTMLSFGARPDQEFVRSLEMQVLWKMRKMSLKQLVVLLTFHVDHQHTDLQKQVVSELLAKIQQRWFEVTSSVEVIALLRHSSFFRSDFIGKLEDQAIDLAEKLSVDDLHSIFVALSAQKLRATHLLRAVTFHLSKHRDKLSVKQMASLANAMNSLSYPDAALLRRLSEDLLPEVCNIEKSSTIAALLTAFGQLHWKHLGLMDAFTDWILKNVDKCRTSDLVAYILAIARLYFKPAESDVVFEAIIPRLTRSAVGSNVVWLDVVWSLAILRRCNRDLLQTVFNKEFCEKLDDFPGYQSVIGRRKMQNIYGVAKWELRNETRLSDILCSDNNQLPPGLCHPVLRNSVLDTLSNYVPKGKFLLTNVATPYGITVDAEFVLDKDGRPLPIDDYNTQFGEISSQKELPAGAHRVALLVLDYKHFTLNHVTLCGMWELNCHILSKIGYRVIQISYVDYNTKAPTVTRLQFLRQKIYQTIGIMSHKNEKE